jgi:hypothetical protein
MLPLLGGRRFIEGLPDLMVVAQALFELHLAKNFARLLNQNRMMLVWRIISFSRMRNEYFSSFWNFCDAFIRPVPLIAHLFFP